MSESSNSSKIPKLNDSEKSKLPINNKDTLFQYWKLTFKSGIYSPENTSLYALLAGIMLGFGFATVLFSESYKTLGLYIISLGVFHFSEYFVTAIFNPDRVKLGSFMYDPVPGYHYAIGFSFLEWFLTRWILPQWVWSYFAIIQFIGFIMVAFGHYFRSGAMIEASTSFNHYVQYKKADDHTLITSGVYQYSRHPSYFGFFYWCIGNQLICFNPISATAFSYVLYKFFSERIEVEERYLVNFFGKEYEDYRSKVPTRLPFIN